MTAYGSPSRRRKHRQNRRRHHAGEEISARELLVLSLLLLLPAAGGCVSVTPAAPYRVTLHPPEPLDQEAWPARRAVEHVIGRDPAATCCIADYDHPPVVVANEAPACAGPEGLGCVHRYECAEDFIDERAWDGLQEVLFFFSERVRTLSGHDSEGNDMQLAVRELAISEFALFQPASAAPRGLVVHLSSLTRYSPQERALIQEMRRGGWSVLVSSRPYFERLGNHTLRLDPTEPEMDGARLAQRNDQMIAEWAYAVEAVLHSIDRRRADPAVKPRIIIGCSAGALCLPAVAARIPQQFHAAVLVAGGADLLTIARRTTLDDHRLRRAGLALHWTREPSSQQWKRLRRAYLQSSHLDPWHTSGYLLDIPVLLLHARFDGIVPAEAGDILYARLGKPERWVYPLSHVGLFLLLPTQTTRIRTWVEAAVE